MEIKRVDNSNEDFKLLVSLLDRDLESRNDRDQEQYTKHNKMQHINTCLVGYMDKKSVACGCFKDFDLESVEIKRVFVLEEYRRKGYSSTLLKELESWAYDLGFKYSFLETGKGQPEAIAMYKKYNYSIIPNYGPYKDLLNSICFKKELK